VQSKKNGYLVGTKINGNCEYPNPEDSQEPIEK
jgi:hypothetical protein